MLEMQFAVVTPPISLDPSLAIAASRSGALGILNLELARTENAARDAVNRLAQFGRGRLGIRIDVADLPLIKGVLGALPAAIGDVIIAGATGITAPSIIAEMRQQGRRVWLEVGSAELADVGVTWGVDALLAKGNEPGGWIGEDSALVLLQQLVARFEIPVFAQGGIGLRTAAACAAGGAAGVVLGEQLALARESTLPLAVKTAIGKLDENETVCLGTELGLRYRVYARAGHRSVAQLEELAASLGSDESAEKNASAWREAVRGRTGWSESGDQVWPIGQDAVFARDLAERYRTVGGVLAAFQDEFESHLRGESRDKARAHVAVRKQTALPARPYRIAIVGMSCILPKAGNLAAYWDNILNKVCGITEVPPDRWDQTLYYDPDPSARDKMNSKWGGFLDPVAFDPTEFGMPPGAVASTDPMQLLALNSARAALKDAGYHKRPFDRSKTAVILGISGGLGNLGIGYTARSAFPHLFGGGAEEQLDRTEGRLPEWTKDSFAGLLPNVTAGRISNRLDLGGTNYIIDAACASSMTAVYLAANELESGSADLAIAGGVDVLQNPQTFMSFSKTHALSPTGQLKAFDANADGVVISDGVVMLVLKRLDDAEHDGDRIYAVIQGVGGSSDGKAKGLTAPRPEGQAAAIRRAYEKAGVSPATVGLFEAHGTGTVVGDRAEALALSTVLEEAGGKGGAHAIGSVKSMIGHTKGAAGAAGLAKAALALYHKTLPPTMGVTDPNPRSRFGKGPLYVNSELRPWIHSSTVHPRRAAVSAFGFGGTNFHAVVEEYRGEFLPPESVSSTWPSELLLWVGESAANIATQVAELEAAFAQGARPELASLAFTLAERYHAADATALHTLAVVACSLEDLQSKLDVARFALANDTPLSDPRGIYYNAATPDAESRIAVLFPGQGSQYTDMLRELAVYFGELREAFERADTVLADRMKGPLSAYVFPIPAFVDEDRAAQQQALTQTDIAQPALAVAGAALFSLLSELGVRAQWAAGHSFGEYVALHAGGVFDFDTLLRLAHERGRSIVESAGDDLGTMAAISAGEEHVARVVLEVSDVCIANINAPAQTIISGTRAGIERALELLRGEGLQARSLPVACAFHSPLVAPAQTRLAEALADIELRVPTLQVLSNTTAKPYPSDPALIRNLLAEHLAKPVRFMDQVLAMHDAGARIFLEVGPRAVLTGLTRQILRDRDHVAIALDAPGRSGVTQLQLALAQLAANGVKLQLGRLFRHRPVSAVDIANLATARLVQTPSANVWMVDGWRARPIHAPLLVRPVAHTAPAARETSATPGGRDSAVVLEDFDRLMQRFLEGQRSAVDTFLHVAREPGIRGQKNAEPQPSERRDPVPDEDPARFRLVAVETPVAIAGALPAFDRVLVITDDGCGIAAAVASRVRRAGGRAVLIREGGKVGEISSEVFQFDPADPNHAVQVLRLVRQRNGPIGGILHLMPLRRTFASDTALRWNAASADLAVWRDVVRRDVKSAFHLARAALDDLALPGSAQTIVMTATALQRNWRASLNAEIGSAQQTAGCPAHAGLIGLLNTLALEVPAVRCRAVDLDPADTVEAMADRIMSELGILVGPAQVGYRGSRRYTAVPVSATLPVSTVREVSPLGPESVVLVTGGGRGITAAVAVALAQLYQPTLVLAGRSPLTADETPATLACRSPAEISSVLIAERQRDGKPVVLAEVSADAQRIINEREIRATLARVRATGSRVRYEKIDVRDADALLALVRRIEAEHGRLDGVIHGAGVIEDRRIGQKEPESFDRVFDTKADSAFVLSQVLDPERTKFLVFFSSAASVFGNPGQADYAAANAVLNALAVDLDSRWPGRVVAIGWGPWGDTGMVSDGVRRELASRGIDVMSAAAGCRALDRELRLGGKGDAAVIVSRGALKEAAADTPQLSTDARSFDHSSGARDTEVYVVAADSRSDLLSRVESLRRRLDADESLQPHELAHECNVPLPAGNFRLAVVAASVADLRTRLQIAQHRIADAACRTIAGAGSIYFSEEREAGKLAFLFPGEGSQYAGMLHDVHGEFAEVREWFDVADKAFAEVSGGRPASEPVLAERPNAAGAGSSARLWEIGRAVPAVLAADLGLYALLSRLGVRPEALCGHSTGEFAALLVSGMLGAPREMGAQFLEELARTGESAGSGAASESVLLAVGTDVRRLSEIVRGGDGVWIGMDNCPHQAVLVCTSEAAERVMSDLSREGLLFERLRFGRPYHTPLFTAFAEPIREIVNRRLTHPAEIPVYSCVTARKFPNDLAEAQQLAVEQWTSVVRFRETVEAMYSDGVRIFVEVGARGNLTGFVKDILRGRPHLAIPANITARTGLAQINHVTAALAANGVELNLQPLYEHRVRRSAPSETAACARAEAESAVEVGAADVPTANVMEVMRAYFKTMERFLDVQQHALEMFLGGRGEHVIRAVRHDPKTGPEIDLAKPVQGIRSAVTRPPIPKTRDEIAAALLHLVSERTGYPADVINPKLDLEADLGIDSIKRVEILGAFQQTARLTQAGDMELLAACKTLDSIIDVLAARLPAASPENS